MTASWLVRQRPTPAATTRLVCVPHAGGAASAFHGWDAALGAGVEVYSATLPGRERRFDEPAVGSMAGVADPLARAVSALDPPVALFGHSMGGLIAVEVAHRLSAAGRSPVALFVAGVLPPGRPFTRQPVSTMDDAQLVGWLRELDGLPAELLADPQMLELLLPTVRTDLLLCETHRYAPPGRLSCPVYAFAGADDPVATPDGMRSWSETTTAEFHLQVLPGGHFFVRTGRAAMTAAMIHAVRRAVPATAATLA